MTNLVNKSFHLLCISNRLLLLVVKIAASSGTPAQSTPTPALPSVTIAAKPNRDPVEKSYRVVIRAINSFDAQRGFENDLQSSFKCLGSAPTTLLRATRWSNVANAPPLLTANASR